MYEQKKATTPSRHAERASYDTEMVHSILDCALIGHLGFVDDGLAHVLPFLFVRDGESVYLHSSTGAHPARLAARRGSLPVSFEVTLIDALVLARSAFSHSVNYRCVVVHGEIAIVGDAERKARVLDALMEKLLPGRKDDARTPADGELRQTALMELVLSEVGAKVRIGDPIDAEEDLGSSVWAGLLPLETRWGAPRPSEDLRAEIPVPTYLEAGALSAGGARPVTQ